MTSKQRPGKEVDTSEAADAALPAIEPPKADRS